MESDKNSIIGKVYRINEIKNRRKEEAIKYFEEHFENIDIYKITSEYFELIDLYLEKEFRNNFKQLTLAYPILAYTIYTDYDLEVKKIKNDMKNKYGYNAFNEGGFIMEYRKKTEYFQQNYVKYMENLINLYPDSYETNEHPGNTGFPSSSIGWLLKTIINKEHNEYQYGKKGLNFEELVRLKFPDAKNIEFNEKCYKIEF